MRSRRGRFRARKRRTPGHGTRSSRRTESPSVISLPTAASSVSAIDGRPPIKIADRPTPVFTGAWWAGDNTVIYSSGRRLQRVSAAGGGTPEPLMPERQPGAVAAPVLLPGGHAVLFHAFDDAAGDRVAVLDLDTGEEKTVVEGGSNPAYVDTGHLVFARGDTLMAVPFKASELAVTGEPVALVQGIRTELGRRGRLRALGQRHARLRTGERRGGIRFCRRVGRPNGQGHRTRRARSHREPARPEALARRQAAAARDGPENDGDLWSYDLSGRPPIPLALPNDNRSPVWSPDGKQVAFLVRETSTVMTVAADGSERTPRPLRAQLVPPQVWSAAGELILTSRLSPPTSSRPPRRRPGEVRNVVASDSVEFDPALSPNGRWLAYVSNRTGQTEIWVQGYPEGAPVRVSSNGGYEPLWSADGRELFYRQGDAVMAVAVETGQRVLVRGAEAPVLGSVRPSPNLGCSWL